MRTINIGEVPVFDEDKLPAMRDEAIKLLEESAEVFAKVEEWLSGDLPNFPLLTEEIADVIQVCANLASMFNIGDLDEYIERCTEKNIERGNITPDEEQDKPQCRNVYGGRDFECSECGMQWRLFDREECMEEWAHVRTPRFCPNCGAEVVE